MANDTNAGVPSRIGPSLGRGRLWRTLLGLAVGLVLLWLAARGIDLGQVWRGVQAADPRWAGAALLAVLLTTAVKVGRWRGLLPRGQDLRWVSLARALLVGQLVNAVLPARMGEVARFYTLGRDEAVSKATTLGTIAAEKTFDVLFLLISAGLAAALVALPGWLHGALAGAAVLGTGVFAAAPSPDDQGAMERLILYTAGAHDTMFGTFNPRSEMPEDERNEFVEIFLLACATVIEGQRITVDLQRGAVEAEAG